MKHSSRALLLSLTVLPMAACSGGGGGGSSAPTASSSARLLVGSTGDPGLFSVGTELTELRLVAPDGTQTPNLLEQPASVEWVGVGASPRWLSSTTVPAGTYTSMQASLRPGSVTAQDTSGSPVPIAEASASFSAPLDQAWVADAGTAPANLVLDLDLSGSVFRQGSGGFVLDPDAMVYLDDQRPIQSVTGPVRYASAFDRLLRMDATGPSGVPYGSLDVSVDPSTLLFDVDGTAFLDPDAFFQSVRSSLTTVEVRGTLGSAGTMSATLVRILDQAGGPSPFAVVMEGRVLHNDPVAQRVVLLMRSIVQGAVIADPVLADLGSPLSIELSYDASTRFMNHEGETESPSDLETGELIRASFPDFVAPPFYAGQIELLDEGRTISGGVVDVAGLPDSFVILVDEDEDENGTLSGRVTVDLTGADIELDFRGHPILGADAIVVGLHVKVRGTLSSSQGTQLIHADRVSVKPGHLIHADVSRFDAQAETFEVVGGKIVQSFGDSVTAPPLAVRLADSVRFLGDAKSTREFFDLLGDLEDDEHVEVKIKGIGTATAEEIEAFEVKVELED